MDLKSPFSISEEQIRALEQNDGFRVVRAYIAKQENRLFCSSHSSLGLSSQQTFILHRDIIHALLLPLLQIRAQAAVFAAHTLSRQAQPRIARTPSSPRSPVDLELAFRGEARGAFSWLQVFVAEEEGWCSTEGCPACVVLKVLHSEPFIRIVIASCRLSSHLKDMLQAGLQSPGVGASTATSSALPQFDFWLSAVHQAVSEDEFWGLHFWEDIDVRARDLELGVKELIRQCCGACSPSPTNPLPQRRVVTTGTMSSLRHTPPAKKGNFVKQQLRLQQEEQQWMRKIVEACWVALVQEAAHKRRKVSATASWAKPQVLRVRSLTS